MSKQENIQTSPYPHPGLNLRLHGFPRGLENVYDYEPGGHHPVHLGDRFGEQRKYKVIHKLGSGGSANVWLCQILDPIHTITYVALKIIMAEYSDDSCHELKVNKVAQLKIDNDLICLPLDQFKITGPNGEHWCFVYPLAGPAVSAIEHVFKDHDRTLRRIALQTVQALAILHDHGICHGDMTPKNVLLRVTGLNGLCEEEVLKILGTPKTFKVTTKSGEPPPETAPEYLIIPIKFRDIDLQFLSDKIYIIDFGESFSISESDPPDEVGTPLSYCSPELLLGDTPSPGSDLWALACTLFSIRTGRKLFNVFDDDPDEYLYLMVIFFGILPEPWWSTSWEFRRKCFKDESDSEGRAIESDPESNKPEGFEARIETGFMYETWPTPGKLEYVKREISPEEVKLFSDLLRQLFRFKPEERLSAKEVQGHEWFSLGT